MSIIKGLLKSTSTTLQSHHFAKTTSFFLGENFSQAARKYDKKYADFNIDVPKYRKRFVENAVFLEKAKMEKRKCFEKIETIQKHCLGRQAKNNMMAQTVYDPEEPTLWMSVRKMYAHTEKLFSAPRPFCNLLECQ